MPNISIITRCLNRLEYTIQTVNCVQKTEHPSYQHVIIDNNSSDGTNQWFKWMRDNTKVFQNLRYYRFDENYGDWGGMLAAQKLLPADCKYVVQLDNDIIVPVNWLTAMQAVLEGTDYKVVMLRRENVLWKLKPLSTPVNIGGFSVVRVERPVACFMMSRSFFDKCCEVITPKKGMRSKYLIAELSGRKIAKIMNVVCSEIDSLTQRKLYDPKNKQIWEKI